MNISMDPEIAKIFKASTTISGKYIFVELFYIALYSLEGNSRSPYEGVSPEEKIKSPDKRGKETGRAKIERDRREVGKI